MVTDERQRDEETAVSERYRGFDFAKNQLEKHGWRQGRNI